MVKFQDVPPLIIPWLKALLFSFVWKDEKGVERMVVIDTQQCECT